MGLTKSVKGILIANIIIFILALNISIVGELVLYPIDSGYFKFYQLITYMFVHGSLLHIVFNMIALVLFGPDIEKRIGENNFIKYYLLSGLISGLFHLIFMNSPVIGASGAVWSMMVMYAFYNPNSIFRVYFLIPIKIKYIVSVLFLLEVYQSIFYIDNISHIAHIGGALAGSLFFALKREN